MNSCGLKKIRKKAPKNSAKDSGKVKGKIKEAANKLNEMEAEINKPSNFVPPDVTPLVRHPEQPAVTVPPPFPRATMASNTSPQMPKKEAKSEFIDEDEVYIKTSVDWNPFLDKIAAIGLCGGFISLGIVIGLHLH